MNEDNIIEIYNKFNRTLCKYHRDKRFSTRHLQEHNIKLDYDLIENMIKNTKLIKLKNTIRKIRSLELIEEP